MTRARPRKSGSRSRPADALADAVSTPAFSSRGGRPRRQGRRVRRVLRRVELWSVLKISLVFNAIMLGVALLSVALLWGLANTTGVVDDLEGFLRDSGFEDFRFEGDRLFRQVAFIGAIGAMAFTVFTVLATALVNLISELTGGIRVVIIEEILDEPAPAAPAQQEHAVAPTRPAPAFPVVPSLPARPPVAPPSPDGDPPRWPGSGPVGPPSGPPPSGEATAPGPGAATSPS